MAWNIEMVSDINIVTIERLYEDKPPTCTGRFISSIKTIWLPNIAQLVVDRTCLRDTGTLLLFLNEIFHDICSSLIVYIYS